MPGRGEGFIYVQRMRNGGAVRDEILVVDNRNTTTTSQEQAQGSD